MKLIKRPWLAKRDMLPLPPPHVVRWFKHAALGFALIVGMIGLGVLVGWFGDAPGLVRVLPGLTVMKVDTAAALILAAAALALLHRESKWGSAAAKIPAALVLALGLITAGEYLFFPGLLGSDGSIVAQILGRAGDKGDLQMSPFSMFCFVGVGLGLLLLDGRKRSTQTISEIATVAALLVGFLGLVGHIYGVSALYIVGQSYLALHSAVAFMLLGIGILASRPDRTVISLLIRNTGGSTLARRFLLAAILVPLALGWIRVKGQEAGFYSTAFGTALMVTGFVMSFAALIWWTATSLDRATLARLRTEEALRDLNMELETRVFERSSALQTAVVQLETEIAERERLERQILEVSEHEQSRLGQDLHDGLGQELAGIAMLAKVLEEKLRTAGHASAAAASDIASYSGDAIQSARRLARGLYPIELSRKGLLPALEDLAEQTCQRSGISCQFRQVGAPPVLEKFAEIHIYRIVQECIGNAIKHGKAARVVIEFLAGDHPTFVVTDNGSGCESKPGNSGMGLQIMKYRGRVIGARIEVSRPEEGGCRVTCRLGALQR